MLIRAKDQSECEHGDHGGSWTFKMTSRCRGACCFPWKVQFSKRSLGSVLSSLLDGKSSRLGNTEVYKDLRQPGPKIMWPCLTPRTKACKSKESWPHVVHMVNTTLCCSPQVSASSGFIKSPWSAFSMESLNMPIVNPITTSTSTISMYLPELHKPKHH